MTVHIYLDNEQETELLSLYDQPVAPFKVGTEIDITIEDIRPKDLIKGNDNYNENIVEENKILRKLCHLKTVKIVRMNTYATISSLTNRITVEYHCKIIN